MFPEPYFVETNSLRMAVYEQGQGKPIIFLHGFPDMAFSWRFQLPAFADAGYRAIAPDLRGYNRTSSPPDIVDYCVEELIADVQGLLEALELDSAVFVGHDWGALLLWQMAMLAPEQIEKLAILNIPHYARAPVDPVRVMRERFGDDFYIVNFQDSDEADRLFGADPGRFIDRMMRKNQVSREQYEKLPPERQVISLLKTFKRSHVSGEPLLSKQELDYYAQGFSRSGFTGPINWYRNWTRNWERLEGINQQIDIPTLFIGARDDVVIGLHHIDGMKPLVSNLAIRMLECGHWTQQEMPDDVNRLILEWLVQRG
jgi:pimeloyl-ACP methyl ester carboxylesterase